MATSYKNPQQVDEVIKELLDYYYEDAELDYVNEQYPIDHPFNNWNVLKSLYDQGGITENF